MQFSWDCGSMFLEQMPEKQAETEYGAPNVPKELADVAENRFFWIKFVKKITEIANKIIPGLLKE